VRVEVVRFEASGLVVKRRFRRRWFTIAYGEILTAERLPRAKGIRLHTVTTEPVRLSVRGRAVLGTEAGLRAQGVRIVDCWGALITPTLDDFEKALAEVRD
jgi:hypothetical protein